MTTKEKILNYLERRKTAPNLAEIAKGAKVNANTLRRLLPQMAREGLISWG